MNIEKGDKITKQSLIKAISTKYDSLISSVINYIPLGFNELYTITAEKVFKIRPKVIQNTYSTRTGSITDVEGGDESQSNIGAAYLGAPYTLELGEALGLSTYANSALGNIEQPFIKSEPLLAYEPITDLIGGGVPFHGNTPFIWRGFLAYSNYFEDTNIRTSVSSDGTTFNLKAKVISLMVRAQSTADFTMGTDAMTTYSDRTNLEMKHLRDINLDATSADIVVDNGAGDYLVWLIYNPSTDTQALIAVNWTSDLTTINGIVNIPYATYFSDYAGYTYTRPVTVVYYDGSKFITTKQQAWGELASTDNADPVYGKQYQQVSSPDPIIRENTTSDDRRLIPSHYYIDQKNNTIIGKTVYSGLVRHIPGAGGNKVKMQLQSGDYTGQGELKVDIGQIELTDGTTSVWVKDLDIPKITFDDGNSYIDDDTISSFTSSHVRSRGYLWLCADIRSILDPEYSNNNLRLKLFTSQSPTWDPDWDSSIITDANKRYGNLGVQSIYSTYTHRCRLGWVNIRRDTVLGDSPAGFRMNNGVYTFDTDILNRTILGLGSTNSYNGGYTLGTTVTAQGTFSEILMENVSSTNTVSFLPFYGSGGTSAACTNIKITLTFQRDGMSTGTAPYIAITTDNSLGSHINTLEGTMGTKANTDITSSFQNSVCLAYSNYNTANDGVFADALAFGIYDLPFNVDGRTKLYFAGTGWDSGRAIVNGYTLPIGNFILLIASILSYVLPYC